MDSLFPRRDRRRFRKAAGTWALAASMLVGFDGARPDVISAGASTITVTRLDDPAGPGACPSDCSLRQAIAAAAPGDTVNLPSGTYTLARGQLLIPQALFVTGSGARTTTIAQTGSNRVLQITGGLVVMSGITMTGGHTVLGGSEPNAGVGGGIWIDRGGSLTLQDSTVSGNHADQSGGGIDVDGTLTLSRSTIAGNDASGGLGIGGGIDAFGLNLAIVNSTIANNTAAHDGGGLMTANATALVNVTIAANSAGGSGGGIFDHGAPGITVLNSILADNTGGNCTTGVTSLGHNISSDASCGFASAGDREAVSPLLGLLQNNGGPTDTLAPAVSSPAIDGGDGNGCPAGDQRGVARPQGAGCDIGAVEVAPPAATLLAFSDGSSIVVINPDGSNPTVVVDGEARTDPGLGDNSFTDPAWSADGRHLAFVGRNDSLTNYSLWTMDYPDGEPHMIASGLGPAPGAPTWSPDGRTIAFDDGNIVDGWKVFAVPSDSSAPPVTLVNHTSKNVRFPSWSPDGTRLAITLGGPDETGNISIYTLATESFASIPQTAGGEFPRWSPDGRRIAFSASGLVSVVDLSTGTATQLSDGSDTDVGPAWSPDGSSLAFMTMTDGGDIWTMSSADGSRRQSVTGATDYSGGINRGHRPVDWQPIVQGLATTTSITSETPDPSNVGQPMRVSVLVSATTAGTLSPTGTVVVTDGTGASCASPLAGGSASCQLTSTSAGDKTLTATYAGDANFKASSGTHPHTVSAGNTAPTVASPAAANPNPVMSGTTTALSVLGADDGGEANLTYTWSASGPAAVTFDVNGTNAAKTALATFTAPGLYAFRVTIADRGGLTVQDGVDVTVNANTAPTVATPASATPNPVTGTTTSLSVLGADNGDESNLTYTWSAGGPAAVSFSVNGTNASKNTVATFTAPGSYTFTVTIRDQGNLTTTSHVDVIVTAPVVVVVTVAEHVSLSDSLESPSNVVRENVQLTDTTVVNTSPLVVAAASAAPNPMTGPTTTLSVLGADDGGEANLAYRWSASGPGAVTFSANGTNAAKNVIATFAAAGTYTVTATIRDQGGLVVISQAIVGTAPVVVGINERISVTDSAGSPPTIPETVHVSDSVAVTVTAPAGDTTPPVLNLPAPVVAEAISRLGTLVHFAATARDGVDGPRRVVCTPPSGTVFPLGVTTVHCTATDRSGNSATGSFTVTVRDTRPPVMTLPTPRTIVSEATGPSGAFVTFSVSAVDVVDGTTAVTCEPSSGSRFPLGTTTVQCSAVDGAGNRAAGILRVVVRDTTPPTLAFAPPVVVNPPVQVGMPVSFRLPLATDIVDPAPIVMATPPSGSVFPIGVTTVTVLARDHSGNLSRETFTVTVVSPAVQLIDNLIGLASTLAYPPGPMFLENVRTLVLDGHTIIACGQLNLFRAQVLAFAAALESAATRTGHPAPFTFADAQILLTPLIRIRGVLGCS